MVVKVIFTNRLRTELFYRRLLLAGSFIWDNSPPFSSLASAAVYAENSTQGNSSSKKRGKKEKTAHITIRI